MQEAPQPVEQTRFSYEEPLFEQPPVLRDEAEENAPVKPWFKTPKGMLILVAVGLLVLVGLLAVAAYMMPRTPQTTPEIVTVTPSPTAALTPNQARLQELQTELEAADPAKQEFPFPPVMMDITLPDPNRRN